MKEKIQEKIICSVSGVIIEEGDEIILYGGGIASREYIENNDGKYIILDGCNSGEACLISEAIYSEYHDEWLIEDDDDLVLTEDDGYIRRDCAWEVYGGGFIAEDNDYYYYIYRGRAEGYYLYCDESAYCVDIEEYVHEFDAEYCDVDEEYYYDRDNMPRNTGPDFICQYHESPEAKDLSNGSLFKVGFEIEKTDFNGYKNAGDEIGEYDIFKGYELDSSCGVEAITHILPLSRKGSKQEEEVFKMMDEASWIINSNTDLSCGGHINISCEKLSPKNLLPKIKPYCGLLYAMYRFRLNNNYSCKNKKITEEENIKYSPVFVKNNVLEFRLFSRVENVSQLKLRYQLMSLLVHHSIKPYGTFEGFLRVSRPILMKMYGGNKEKVKTIESLAYKFRDYLVLDKVDPEINVFLN